MKNLTLTQALKQAAFSVLFALLSMALWAMQSQAAVKRSADILPIEGRYALSAAIGHDQPGYHARMAGGAVEAENTGHGLTIRFSDAGVEFVAGRQSIALRPVMWGYGDEMTALLPGLPQAFGNMVTVQRGAVSEWYVNGPLGLQQGFTVKDSPQAGSGPLRIAMAIDGAVVGRVDDDGHGLILTRADGTSMFRYSGLVVRDAFGREAGAWIEAKAGMLKICVDDTGLTYPLYIDPVIQAAKLTASDGAANDWFGCSVAISGDTVVVGARSDDIGATLDQGSAYVFMKPSGGWTEGVSETAKLTASDGAASDCFGCSVAISGDTVVVGAPFDDIGATVDQGSAYVFVKPAGGWVDMNQTAKLTASDGAANDWFGAVAISGDTVVVGAVNGPGANSTDQGAGYIFVKPPDGWVDMTQTAKLTASDGAAVDYFSASVAISGDTVVAGAPDDDVGATNMQGSAYVFVKPTNGWATMTQTAKLTASDGVANDYFGGSVAVSDATVVVGVYAHNIGANVDQGAAYVFVKPSSGWVDMSHTAKLTASDGAANDWFGWSVSVSGSTVVVAARDHNVVANVDQGTVYAYVKPSQGWEGSVNETAKLIALDGEVSDKFGMCVALTGDTIVVGTIRDDIGSNADQGSAYVFKIIADEPIGQATNVSFSSVADDSMIIKWTPGTGTGSIALMKQGSAVDAALVDGFDYTANAAFVSGSQIGTGNYVVYSGSGDTVTVTGLSPETTYYVAVYDYSVSPPSEAANYRQLRPTTGSQSTSTDLVAVADNYTTAKNKTLIVEASGVLANDAGSGLTAIPVSDPAQGTLSLAADGSFIYIPTKGFKGADSFTYKVSDGVTESASATVTITVGKKCPMVKLYGEDSAQVELMRRYRDEGLEKTAAGRLSVDIYYGMAPVVDKALENPWLQEQAKKIIDGLLPVVEKRLK